MKNKNYLKERDAVAGVIEALLLVALVAIVLSTIQLIYIPQVMEQREADHEDSLLLESKGGTCRRTVPEHREG